MLSIISYNRYSFLMIVTHLYSVTHLLIIFLFYVFQNNFGIFI